MRSINIGLDGASYLEHGRDPKAFTCITYMYTCAANYKTMDEVQVRGIVKPEVFAHLDSVLFDSECFLPRQIGLPSLAPEPFGENYDDEVDHSLHTVERVCWGPRKENVRMASLDAAAFTEKVMAIKGESDWDFEQNG